MSDSVVVQGTVLPDGTLQVSGKVGLPAGPVEVVVRSIATPKQEETVMDYLARIRADQEARGYVPRSAEEVNAYLQEIRDEWAERDASIEAIQEEARLAREKAKGEGA